jgi:UDP-N-acetylmuramoylalanine--D-glutamate ligase
MATFSNGMKESSGMELRGKRVLVVGLGKSGLAAALFLRERGAQVTVSDARSAQALAQEIPTLLDHGIAVETGGHGVLTFRRQDLIVVSPGVPLDTPELVNTRALGLPIIGELELAARFLRGKVLAITGSNGKTTTTSLCGEIFARAGLPTVVAGNIGVPVISLAERTTDATWSVLEVSSFQLETTESFHPAIAVVLNITPDHLDRHGNFENYVAAKARIFANLNANDWLVLNADDDVTHRLAAQSPRPERVVWFSRARVVRQGCFVHDGLIVFKASEQAAAEPVMPVTEVPLKGLHNLENVLAAVCASRLAGIAAETIRAAVIDFRAVEHRLEFVARVNGVEYYNDSKATNVDAAAKALESFGDGEVPVVHLILGGKDKDSDYGLLREAVRARARAVYTIGSAAEKIERQLAGDAKLESCETLDAAIARAAAAAAPGEVVLLAPACSSFDQFENYEHRGRVFKALVAALAEVSAGQ